MSKDPAVLFYTSDFLTGTAFFNDAQRGQYIKLLCEQHQIGHIPPEHMLEVCKTADSPVIRKFVTDDNGYYYNERMEEEIEKRQQFSEYQRKKANKRWENKETEETELCPGNAPAMPGDMPEGMPEACMRIENENENINESADVVVNANRGESAERGEKQKNQPQVKTRDFIDQVVDEFVEATGGEYIIVSRGKERGAAGKLVNIFKKIFPDAGTRELLDQLRDYFTRCVTIEDPWLRDNMSLSIIISKFNEINKILKNGRSKGTGVTDAELADLMARKHGINAPAGAR